MHQCGSAKKGMKLLQKLPVAEKLGLDGEPDISSSGALGGDDFGEIVSEGAENQGLHHTVHPDPIRCVETDVIPEGKLIEGQHELITPAIEVTKIDVEDDRD